VSVDPSRKFVNRPIALAIRLAHDVLDSTSRIEWSFEGEEVGSGFMLARALVGTIWM
jgi:hypothetical protein